MSVAARFEIEFLQYLGADGRLVAGLPRDVLPKEEILELFRQMLFLRTFDGKAVALQRTGKLGTYAPCLGHEATQIGIGRAMAQEDVLAPSYREYGAQIMRGVRLREILMYWGGDERGNDYRNEPARHDFPWAVPISTQCLHAAGAALAFRLRGEKRVAVTCCGDGGSSKTDTYAAINAAGAYTLPFVQCIINNGWAISVPRSAQTGAPTLAQKGLAGGLHCLQVDGNDLFAVLEGMRRAMERARGGEGGTVIEFLTYRLHDHTTADDARRYRDEAEVKDAWTRDPVTRLRSWLSAQGLWDEAAEAEWIAECTRRVDAEIDAYLGTRTQPPETMFDYLYADPPPDILEQRARMLAREGRA